MNSASPGPGSASGPAGALVASCPLGHVRPTVAGGGAPSTPAGTAHDRVDLMVDGKGHTMFMLLDAQAVPVVMAKGGDKGGALQVSEMTPDGKHLQARTPGAKGDTQSTEDAD